jgi:hypothetical protein
MADITVGYNENDFLYSKFRDDNTNIITDSNGKVSKEKCSRILEPTNKQNFLDDISQNLQIYLQNINLDEGNNQYEDVLYNFDKNGNMILKDKTNGYNFETEKGGIVSISQNKFGKIGNKVSLNFNFPTVKNVSVSPFGDGIPGENGGSTGTQGAEGATEDQSTSFFTTNEKQPRCFVTNKCTKLHYHYQAYYYDDTGENGCTCTPIGNQVYDNNPHSHCEIVDTSDLDESQMASVKKNVLSGVDNLNSVEINLESDPANNSAESLGELNVGVDTSSIVEEIYKYYRSVCENKNKATDIRKKTNMELASGQMYDDANTAYKGAYLKVLNTSAGILVGLASIYLLSTTNAKNIAKSISV